MKKITAIGLILMMTLIPAAGSVKAANSGTGVVGAALAWYYLYLHQNKTFSELYNLSVQNGVDNDTLSLAHELWLNASEEFKTALSYGSPQQISRIRWLPFMMHVRRAYLTLMEANELLKKALKEKGIEVPS
ncbi:MAG: pyrolysin [Thermococcus sp.]|nr:pyrolysin [Thermococcus sp.]